VPRQICPRHGKDHPCTCAMGNIYRFVEPVVLFMLQEKGQSYGYSLAADLADHALTDAEIEVAALYRTLRRLEDHGYVSSRWDTNGAGPARRLYLLTKEGEHHLQEWGQVLGNLSKAMGRFVRKVHGMNGASSGRRTGPARTRVRRRRRNSR
jgi:PadR family transcriptional regulator PadR